MADCMTFPETVDEFMESYKMVDTEHIYSNGIEYVPIFRMKQWFEHLPERKTGRWSVYQMGRWVYAQCSECGAVKDVRSDFCPNCGCRMTGVNE